MELDGEEGLAAVADAFVRGVIEIYEERLPACRKRIFIDSISVILGSDETMVAAYHLHWLVMTAMAVFQFVCLCSGSFGEQLVAHTDAEYRTSDVHRLPYVLHCDSAIVRVAGAVRYEQAVIVLYGGVCIEIIVPGHPYHLYSSLEEAADDVMLHSAIHQHHLFACSLTVADDVAARCRGHQVAFIGILIIRHHTAFLHQPAQHRSAFTQYLRQAAGVDSPYTGYTLFPEPLVKALGSTPVAVVEREVGYY